MPGSFAILIFHSGLDNAAFQIKDTPNVPITDLIVVNSHDAGFAVLAAKRLTAMLE